MSIFRKVAGAFVELEPEAPEAAAPALTTRPEFRALDAEITAEFRSL